MALLSLRRSKAYCGRFFGDMLASGLAEQHPELAQRCLTESLYFVPFVNVLQSSEASVQRKAARSSLASGRRQSIPARESWLSGVLSNGSGRRGECEHRGLFCQVWAVVNAGESASLLSVMRSFRNCSEGRLIHQFAVERKCCGNDVGKV